jgi:hypothetical protein
MSRIDEICQVYNVAYDEIANYLQDINDFLSRLLGSELSMYLHEELDVQYRAKDKSFHELNECLYLDGEFWRIDAQINFAKNLKERNPNTPEIPRLEYFPPNRVRFSILLKRESDFYLIRLAGFAKDFRIPRGNNSSPEENDFYDFLFEKIKEYYQNMSEYFVKYGKIPDRLGENA